MKKMRVLAITNLYPRPGHELIAPFNRQQFRALAQSHEVRVIAPVPWHQALHDKSRRRSAAGYTNADGIHVDHPTYYYPPRVMRSQAGQFFYRSIRHCAQRAIAEFQPNVLLACWAHPDGWAAVRLARQAGVPVVIKVIGSDVLVVPRGIRRRACISEALSRADRIVAVSRDLADHVERLGVDRRRIDVVPEGIDREVFAAGDQDGARRRLGVPDGRPTILFVGNLLFGKGAGVLVEACRMLRGGEGATGRHGAGARDGQRELNKFVCYLVGAGRDESRIRSLIAKYCLGECVKLVGPCAHADLPDWYRASDVVALPSFSEGIPNVLREALECGRPFVATRVGGIPEISDPCYSRLIERGDAPALARALAEMLAAAPRVDAALVRRANVSWQESAGRLAESLAARGPGRARVEMCSPRLATSAAAPRLRVLAITNQYPRLGNDATAPFNRQQFSELAGLVDLRVVVPLRWPEVLREWLSLDPRPRHFCNREGIWVDTPCFMYPPKLLLDRHGPLLLQSIRARVERLLDEFQPDVLLGSWAYPDGWATVRLARRAGLPVVVKVHGSDVLVLRHDARRRKQLTEALSRADRVVAVSADLAEQVAALGVPEQKIVVVRNGVDDDLFRPGDRAAARAWLGLPQEGPLVLFVGNILRSKGAEVLVEACRRLRELGRVPRCVLLGSGRDAGRVAALIRRYKLDEQITLEGGRIQEQLPAWYQACDVVALPSFSEGSPNVLHEAIACGRPFVATQVGGIPEIAHPSYSRLVPPGDADALAAALDELLTIPRAVDAELVKRRSLSWQESAEQLAEVLTDASEGSGVQDSAEPRSQESEVRDLGTGRTRGAGTQALTPDPRILTPR